MEELQRKLKRLKPPSEDAVRQKGILIKESKSGFTIQYNCMRRMDDGKHHYFIVHDNQAHKEDASLVITMKVSSNKRAHWVIRRLTMSTDRAMEALKRLKSDVHEQAAVKSLLDLIE